MLNTIYNVLLNTGLGLGFFEVYDDSLEAFLERLGRAISPRQISPILFSHILDPLWRAVGAPDLGFRGTFRFFQRILRDGFLSPEIVKRLEEEDSPQDQQERTVQLTKDGTCPCRDECRGNGENVIGAVSEETEAAARCPREFLM